MRNYKLLFFRFFLFINITMEIMCNMLIIILNKSNKHRFCSINKQEGHSGPPGV